MKKKVELETNELRDRWVEEIYFGSIHNLSQTHLLRMTMDRKAMQSNFEEAMDERKKELALFKNQVAKVNSLLFKTLFHQLQI